MKILAIDTSTTHLTIALMDGLKTVASYHEKVDRNHSSLLVPMIEKTVGKLQKVCSGCASDKDVPSKRTIRAIGLIKD